MSDQPVRPLADVEREAILAALHRIRHVGRAAEALGISPGTLYNRMREYGVRLEYGVVTVNETVSAQ